VFLYEIEVLLYSILVEAVRKMLSSRLFLGGCAHRTAVYIEVHEDLSTRPTTKLSKISIFFDNLLISAGFSCDLATFPRRGYIYFRTATAVWHRHRKKKSIIMAQLLAEYRSSRETVSVFCKTRFI
jgi:hypothetical protein